MGKEEQQQQESVNQQDSQYKASDEKNSVPVKTGFKYTGFDDLVSGYTTDDVKSKNEEKSQDEDSGKKEMDKSEKSNQKNDQIKGDEKSEQRDLSKLKFEEMTPEERLGVLNSFGKHWTDAQDKISKMSEYIKEIYSNPIEFLKNSFPELAESINYTPESIPRMLDKWQQNQLVPYLRTIFKNIPEDWEPDPTDMNPNSPSYQYRALSDRKFNELSEQVLNYQNDLQEKERRLQELNELQKKSNQEDFEILRADGITGEMLRQWASEQKSAAKDQNALLSMRDPHRMINMIRGVFFEKLSDMKVKKAVDDLTVKHKEEINKIHEAYKEKGINIPKGKMPVDVTKHGSNPNTLPGDKKVNKEDRKGKEGSETGGELKAIKSIEDFIDGFSS